MPHERVFPGVGFKSHMPFFDGETLLFCRSDEPVRREFECGGTIWKRMRTNRALAEHFRDLPRSRAIEYRAWKLYYTAWRKREPCRLVTGLPDDAVECSPTAFREGDKLHVSFIGGIASKHEIAYRLYQMTGPSWNELSEAKRVLARPVRAGCVAPGYIAFARRGDVIIQNRDGSSSRLLECPLERVFRISFRPKQEQDLVITGVDEQGRYPTLLYNLDSGQTQEVRSSEDVYKPSIVGERMVSAHRKTGGFEERELWHGDFELVESRKPIRRRED